jgi:hypothetical protein
LCDISPLMKWMSRDNRQSLATITAKNMCIAEGGPIFDRSGFVGPNWISVIVVHQVLLNAFSHRLVGNDRLGQCEWEM